MSAAATVPGTGLSRTLRPGALDGWTERRIGTARRYDSTGGRLTVLHGSGAWTVFCWREAPPAGLRGQANGSRYFGADGAAAVRLALRAERLLARWGRR